MYAIRSYYVNVLAIILGATKYLNGFVESVCNAAICSVTLIVPISAAIDAPTRP